MSFFSKKNLNNYSILNSKITYHLLTVLLLISVVIFKYEALFLPFFWDEAWVYMPAIRTMSELGPSILPGAIEAELYTGHPLLFYFVSSLWIKTFGYSLFIAHLFPLLISLGLISSVYYIVINLSKSYFFAFLAALLLAIQPFFLTQSTFLLIEVWLSLLILWSIFFYTKKKYFLCLFFIVLALWSKESAYVIIPTLLVASISEFIIKKQSIKVLFFKITLFLFAFLIGFSFFIIQKTIQGWYFFPRHMNWINFKDALYMFLKVNEVILIKQNRLYYIIPIGIIAIFGLYTKRKLKEKNKEFLFIVLIFWLGFSIFSSINFFSSRYIFTIIPLLIISLILFLQEINIKSLKIIYVVYFLILGSVSIFQSKNSTHWNDTELSYKRLLIAQVDFVKYIYNNTPDEKVFAPFLMHYNLNNPYSGFINEPLNIYTTNPRESDLKYFIYVSNEKDQYVTELLESNKLDLVYESSHKQAWVKLYKVK